MQENNELENPKRERGSYHLVTAIVGEFKTKQEVTKHLKANPELVTDCIIIQGKKREVAMKQTTQLKSTL